jgi:hypothetical protein
MGSAESTTSVSSDVLHSENHSKLSPEEIAKALAHHNRHHGGGQAQGSAVKPDTGKKHAKSK